MNKTILRNYAKLIVKMGVNVQKGQDVIVQARVNEILNGGNKPAPKKSNEEIAREVY